MRGNHPRTSKTAATVRVASIVLLLLLLGVVVANASVATSDAAGNALWDSSWGAAGDEDEAAFDLEEELAAIAALEEVASVDAPTSSSSTQSAAAVLAPEDDDDEPWKNKDDWWKDPLSMFDENDEFVDDAENVKEQEPISEEFETEDEDLQMMDEDVEYELLMEDEEAALAAAEEAALKEIEAEEAVAKKAAKKAAKASAKKAAKAAKSSSSSSPLKERLAFLKPGQQEKPKNSRKEKTEEASSGINVSALTAASVPALKAALTQGTLLATSLPAFKVLATMAVGKAVYETVMRRTSQDKQGYESEDPEVDAEYNAILMENPMHYSMDDPSRFSDDEEESEYEHVDSDVDSAVGAHGNHQDSNSHQHHSSARRNSGGNQGGVFGGIRSALIGGGSNRAPLVHGAPTGGLLSRKVRVTADELEFLKVQAEKAMMERQGMEQEYEKTSFQLQEAQSEVTQLASTTKYLKSQLRDYEEMMDRTIRNEPRKAKAEIQRIKDSLERAREQEQEALRRQFVKEMHKMQGTYEAERAEREAMLVRAGASSPQDDSNHHHDSEESRQHTDSESRQQHDSESNQESSSPRKPKKAKRVKKDKSQDTE